MISIAYLRESWKNTVIIVRGDSHFCSKQLMDWSHDKINVHFITGLTGNRALNARIKEMVQSCEERFKRDGKPIKRYHSFSYKADSWENQQRVIVKQSRHIPLEYF